MDRPRGLTDREWIDTLEERVRQLTEALAPPKAFPAAWRLTPAGSRLLRALMARAPHLASTESLCLALERPGAEEPITPANLQTQVCKLRARLRVHAPGVEILAVWGEGYALDAASAARLDTAGDPTVLPALPPPTPTPERPCPTSSPPSPG